MRLSSVELRLVELDLVAALGTATGTHARRPLVLVRLATDEGEGAGECSALASPTYTEEYAAGAFQVLAEVLVPMLLAAREFERSGDALAALSGVRGNKMAKAALEMAVLDVEGRTAGQSLASMIGADALSVPAGATLGLERDVDALLASVRVALDAGYGRLKCKIEPGWDVEPLTAIMRAHPGLILVADANASYRLDSRDDEERLDALDALGLTALEQPLEPGDLAGHAALAKRLETPVLLDESVPDLDALDAALALRAGDAVSLKPGRLGGVAAAAAAIRRCGEAGVPCGIGGLLESGLGRAASLAVAALPGVDLPGELGASDRYFVPDLTSPHVVVGGRIAVPTGPGLGVELCSEIVEAHTTRRVVVGAAAGAR